MNKKTIYFLFTFLALLVSSVLISFFTTENAYTTSVHNEKIKPVVIIDPGHGGEDGGADANNIVEKDINLKISKKLRDFFVSNGFDVIMTRDTDIALINSDNSTFVKKDDLQKRVDIFNSSDKNIVISIHQNKFTQPQYSGTQVFYSPNNEQSKLLAEKIRASVTSLIQKDNTRQIKKAGSEIFVLNNAFTPAILVECGFLSNYEEAMMLNTDAYQSKLAYCIYLGFLEYYYTNY